MIRERLIGRGCPFCSRNRVSVTNSLATTFPKIAAEWHTGKNGDLTPDAVSYGSMKTVWWKGPKGDDHQWRSVIANRTAGNGCPFCGGDRASGTNSLAALAPEVAVEWHPGKNGELTPNQVTAGSGRIVWWKCRKGPDHEWRARVYSRVKGGKCPCCAGRQASATNSLATVLPEIAAQWHPTLNSGLTAADVVPFSNKRVWWKCPAAPDHEWEMMVSRRTEGAGCPMCEGNWTVANIRRFVKSLIDQNLLNVLDPAELWLLFQQNGLFKLNTRRGEFVKAVMSGRIPREELEKFANGESTPLDELFDETTAEEWVEVGRGDDVPKAELTDEPASADGTDLGLQLPNAPAGEILDALDSHHWSSADAEAVEFLVASGVSKLWRRAYVPEYLAQVRYETEKKRDGTYSERVRSRFRAELDAAESLAIPAAYRFTIDDDSIAPNLMQRHVAALVKGKRRVGNWSGTGAGKTLSAVLASRVIRSAMTVIVCPNSVVTNWCHTIVNAFASCRVARKTLEPEWIGDRGPQYLVLNYETLQQPDSEPKLAAFLKDNQVDMIVVDEIHYAKQRAEEASQRRRLAEAMCSTALEANPRLAVLGMSATPVINNLREGVSMIDLVTGLDHSDLETKATVNNCMRLHQKLATVGVRWMPPYPRFSRTNPRIDVTDLVDDIRALPQGSSGVLQLERLLIEAKLDSILENIQDGTVIFTQYVSGIVPLLSKALTQAGWKVGRFTGLDKRGLAAFLKGDVNVLIGSSAVGTGVDGLQHRAARLIIACAPWTSAAYEQFVGRLVRQGQQRPVEVIFPITFANVNGQEWSWCQARLNRIEYKKSIADAAVDGIVPTGQLRSPAEAFQDAIGWLRRLEESGVHEIWRPRVVVPLSDAPVEVERRRARYGDFSSMNNRWNGTRSDRLHERLRDNPEEWANYHTLYQHARSTWEVIPYEHIGDLISRLRKNQVIGDFGCGEDLLGQRLRKAGFTVHSFDHVAISDDVVACDIGTGVPLDDAELDVAVFALSHGIKCR